MPIRICLADDHHLVRDGLRSLLEAEPDLEIVCETGDGGDVVGLVKRAKPDVVLLDLMMPGLNGLEVTRQLQEVAPTTRVLILSMYASDASVTTALRNGASGYVLKGSRTSDLLKAIREVAAGRRYLTPSLRRRSSDGARVGKHDEVHDPYETLTKREREVLQLAAEGKTNNQIAERLAISRRTVEVHRSNLMHKLGFSSHVDLVRYAVGRGLVSLDDVSLPL